MNELESIYADRPELREWMWRSARWTAWVHGWRWLPLGCRVFLMRLGMAVLWVAKRDG